MTTSLSRLVPFALVVLLSAPAAAQSNPHGQLHLASFPEPYLLLIRDPLVHDELDLDEEQRRQVRELNDSLDPDLWSMRNQTAEHVQETVRDATATARARLAELLTREQRQRLAQVELWALGTRAFLRDELPQKLRLSADALSDTREIVVSTQQAVDQLAAEVQSGESDKSFEKEGRSLKYEEQKQILEVLTPAQRQHWVKLLGKRVEVSRLGRVTFQAPELAGATDWVNTPPLTLDELRGEVVAIHFYAFGCINCKRNFPWYKAWHEDYADRGLVVLGVHTPETSRERDAANVRQAAREEGLAFPILIDNEQANWNAWGNSMWPSVYLIDRQGRVRAWWYGELNWEGAEGEKMMRERIEALLGDS